MWQELIAPNGEASLCYRNHAETTVLMCEQIPSYPIYGFRASAKGIRYGVNTESATEPSQLLLLLLLFLSTVEPLHNGHLWSGQKKVAF